MQMDRSSPGLDSHDSEGTESLEVPLHEGAAKGVPVASSPVAFPTHPETDVPPVAIAAQLSQAQSSGGKVHDSDKRDVLHAQISGGKPRDSEKRDVLQAQIPGGKPLDGDKRDVLKALLSGGNPFDSDKRDVLQARISGEKLLDSAKSEATRAEISVEKLLDVEKGDVVMTKGLPPGSASAKESASGGLTDGNHGAQAETGSLSRGIEERSRGVADPEGSRRVGEVNGMSDPSLEDVKKNDADGKLGGKAGYAAEVLRSGGSATGGTTGYPADILRSWGSSVDGTPRRSYQDVIADGRRGRPGGSSGLPLAGAAAGDPATPSGDQERSENGTLDAVSQWVPAAGASEPGDVVERGLKEGITSADGTASPAGGAEDAGALGMIVRGVTNLFGWGSRTSTPDTAPKPADEALMVRDGELQARALRGDPKGPAPDADGIGLETPDRLPAESVLIRQGDHHGGEPDAAKDGLFGTGGLIRQGVVEARSRGVEVGKDSLPTDSVLIRQGGVEESSRGVHVGSESLPADSVLIRQSGADKSGDDVIEDSLPGNSVLIRQGASERTTDGLPSLNPVRVSPALGLANSLKPPSVFEGTAPAPPVGPAVTDAGRRATGGKTATEHVDDHVEPPRAVVGHRLPTTDSDASSPMAHPEYKRGSADVSKFVKSRFSQPTESEASSPIAALPEHVQGSSEHVRGSADISRSARGRDATPGSPRSPMAHPEHVRGSADISRFLKGRRDSQSVDSEVAPPHTPSEHERGPAGISRILDAAPKVSAEQTASTQETASTEQRSRVGTQEATGSGRTAVGGVMPESGTGGTAVAGRLDAAGRGEEQAARGTERYHREPSLAYVAGGARDQVCPASVVKVTAMYVCM